MRFTLVVAVCGGLLALAAGSTLQLPFLHESREDQLAVASSAHGATIQQPFIHALRQDQLAVPTGPAGRVAAPPTGPAGRVADPPTGPAGRVAAPPAAQDGDRTPAARVPVALPNDVIVLDGSEAAGPGPAPQPGPAYPSWLRAALQSAAAGPYPGWLRGAAPAVLLLQPIILPVAVPESVPAAARSGPDYYGAADPARLQSLRRL